MEKSPEDSLSRKGLFTRWKTARKLAKATEAIELVFDRSDEPQARIAKFGRSTVTIAHTH